MNHLETKEERFRSELDLSISVCWVFLFSDTSPYFNLLVTFSLSFIGTSFEAFLE